MKNFLWRSDDSTISSESWTKSSFQDGQHTFYLATHIGGPRSRYTNNQDVIFLTSEESGLRFGIADGAGSTVNGLKAASLYVDQACRLGTPLMDTFLEADRRIRTTTRQNEIFDPKTSGYGAAVCAEYLDDQHLLIGTWGDCRALLLRNGEIVTEGTTLPQNVLFSRYDRGEISLADYYRAEGPSYLSGGIGLGDLPDILLPLVTKCEIQSGDRLILGSDGLWDMVTDLEISQLAATKDDREFQEQILELALQRNNSTTPIELKISSNESVRFIPDGADNTSIIIACW